MKQITQAFLEGEGPTLNIAGMLIILWPDTRENIFTDLFSVYNTTSLVSMMYFKFILEHAENWWRQCWSTSFIKWLHFIDI